MKRPLLNAKLPDISSNGESMFWTVSSFSAMIESLVEDHDGSYMETITHVCEERGFDIEEASKLLSMPIRERLRLEGENKHLLKRKSDASKLF